MGSGFTTFTAGNVLTASEMNNYLMEQSVMSFATAAARASAVTAPETGMMYWDQALLTLNVYNGSAWVSITRQAAVVATSQTTTSGTYADLATSGPAVSVTTGTKALVTLGCGFQHSVTTALSNMGFTVSGATTVAAANASSVQCDCTVINTVRFRYSNTILVTGLTAGINTFTAKYLTNAATATFSDRVITVEALP